MPDYPYLNEREKQAKYRENSLKNRAEETPQTADESHFVAGTDMVAPTVGLRGQVKSALIAQAVDAVSRNDIDITTNCIMALVEKHIEQIIGEDEPRPDKSRYKEYLTRSERTVITRNVLRAEQRKRLEGDT